MALALIFFYHSRFALAFAIACTFFFRCIGIAGPRKDLPNLLPPLPCRHQPLLLFRSAFCGDRAFPDIRFKREQGVLCEGKPIALVSPCADCGVLITTFCDGAVNACYAKVRMPKDGGGYGQRAPFCDVCGARYAHCHFCYGLMCCRPDERSATSRVCKPAERSAAAGVSACALMLLGFLETGIDTLGQPLTFLSSASYGFQELGGRFMLA